MVNYWMALTEEQNSDKEIVRISYKIVSPKKFKAMSEVQKKTLIGMIGRFEASLKATKKELTKK